MTPCALLMAARVGRTRELSRWRRERGALLVWRGRIYITGAKILGKKPAAPVAWALGGSLKEAEPSALRIRAVTWDTTLGNRLLIVSKTLRQPIHSARHYRRPGDSAASHFTRASACWNCATARTRAGCRCFPSASYVFINSDSVNNLGGVVAGPTHLQRRHAPCSAVHLPVHWISSSSVSPESGRLHCARRVCIARPACRHQIHVSRLRAQHAFRHVMATALSHEEYHARTN